MRPYFPELDALIAQQPPDTRRGGAGRPRGAAPIGRAVSEVRRRQLDALAALMRARNGYLREHRHELAALTRWHGDNARRELDRRTSDTWPARLWHAE